MPHDELEKIIDCFALGKREYIRKDIFFQAFKTDAKHSLLLPYLSAKEREQSQQIRHEAKRHAYISTHALRRILLSLVNSKEMAPQDWVFQHNAQGKPFVTEKIEFNISYANNIAIIAISLQGEIGIDIAHDSPIPYKALPLSLLHPNELTLLSKIKKEDTYGYFLKMWTYKEAFSKALGLGVYLDFKGIDSTIREPIYQGYKLTSFQKKLKIKNNLYYLSIVYKK